MGKRGPEPRKTISEKWSPQLAYAIGLLVTDGCLARKNYLVDLTSKDLEQLQNFSKCIGRQCKIGYKSSGYSEKNIGRIQFKNYYFYNFLLSIGLMPAKSRIIGAIKIPSKYFWDFVRGAYDGDGSSYSYWDPRWKSSFMFYTSFVSASPAFIEWMRSEVRSRVGAHGHISASAGLQQLRYAKADSLKILRKMYHTDNVFCLSRKKLKIERILATVGEKL
ncbi:MAG TPA: hypothetical protein VJH69_03185 [Candidatus Paceibacterota bacterium]|uniref:Homing endonuclease LAGLIDADG domain-containing protein n=1 Tax=Candidatus Ryanbacteria bacterium RIFCSPHIGHO2_01_FULL_45_22 TaxID=1802114 RepID=A0A1G2G1N0_9BACT|nr:MAG: hypothetical protein A2719_00180 [Candidatus Ryanbacteria bacterium RIFCSPHIGHO2_01_FULL_45_22]